MTDDKNNFQLLLQELEGLKVPSGTPLSPARRYGLNHNATIDKCIEIVTKHTAAINLEEVEKLVQRYSREDRFKESEEEFIAQTWRTSIGYTLDANGKAVAIQKGGEGNG